MARPRTFDMEVVQDGLLDAFWVGGFQGTSLPDLTAATGLRPGSLYAAFGSKDEMFRLALRRYAKWLVGQLPVEMRGLPGIEAILNTTVRLTVDDQARRGCPMLNAIPAADELSEKTSRTLGNGLSWMRRLFRERLQEAQAQAGVSIDAHQIEAVLISAAVAIRVLGRANASQRLLQNIADGATGAARLALDAAGPAPQGRASAHATEGTDNG